MDFDFYHYVRVASIVVPLFLGYKGIQHSVAHGWQVSADVGCGWCFLTEGLIGIIVAVAIITIGALVACAWEDWDGF